MANPRRWLDDDAPPEIRRLLHAARREVPPRRAVDRAVRVIGAAGVLGTATTTAIGAAAKVAASSASWAVVKWGALAVLGLGVATTTTTAVRHYASKSTPAATRPIGATRGESMVRRTVALAPATRSNTSQQTSEPSEPLPAASHAARTGSTRNDQAVSTRAPITPAEVTHSAPPPRAGAASHRAATWAGSPAAVAPVTASVNRSVIAPAQNQNTQTGSPNGHAASSPALGPAATPNNDAQLLEEMRFLDQARAALLSGQTRDAMRWLREYRRSCPAQRLMPEALLLAMQAAVRQGDMTNAAEIAREIWTRFPNSPHAAKAREFLAASAPRSTEHQSDGN